MSKPRKPPKREEVKAWLADGKWGGPGIGPLIDNACWVAAAYLRALDVVETAEAQSYQSSCRCAQCESIRRFREGE